jgi:hypothetical protein
VLDNPSFAGGPFSYWVSQGLGLQHVGLTQRASLLPSLRSSKFEGQSNFVNPGLLLANLGWDGEVSPKLKAVLNVNYLRFVNTAVLKNFLNQPNIHKQIGVDAGAGVIYRPFLNNNAAIVLGASALEPLQGFQDIYASSQILYAFFSSIVFTY